MSDDVVGALYWRVAIEHNDICVDSLDSSDF